MRELLAVVHNANSHMLAALLANNPPERHRELTGAYARLMGDLVSYCEQEFLAAERLTTVFIRGLHRMLYPPGYVQQVALDDGRTVAMQPGEYKCACQGAPADGGRGMRMFMPPEQAPTALECAVQVLEQQLRTAPDKRVKRDVIIVFCLEFLQIHPFFDANGRMACMLTDLLLLREQAPAINFSAIYRASPHHKAHLIALIEEAYQTRNLDRLNRYIAAHHELTGKGETQHGH